MTFVVCMLLLAVCWPFVLMGKLARALSEGGRDDA